MAHEWIEDYESYEAVLRCTNVLGDWDSAATLRAFQTFQFDDATTPGNDQCFCHTETGVIVRHDGDMLAIDYGSERLPEALTDLFHVLVGLGWRKAEVYHPSQTMGALLTDIGKAITAQMEFDVVPAQSVSEPAQFSEGRALVQRGTAMLQQGAGGFNDVALDALSSMAPQTYEPVGGDLRPAATGQQIRLDDDLGALPETVSETPRRSIAFVVPTDDQEFGTRSQPIAQAPAGAVAMRATEPEPHPELKAADHAAEPVHPPVSSSVVARVAPQEPVVVQHAQRVPMQLVDRELLLLGASAFCFDVPGQAMGMDAVEAAAENLGVVDVVHLWPGHINQDLRWDLLGELDQDHPWFAEKMAGAMGAGCAQAVVGACMSQFAKSKGQLRDVLELCIDWGIKDGASRAEVLSSVAAEMALKRLKQVGARGGLEGFLEVYAGLLSTNSGDAFVDLPVVDDQQTKTFCVRSLIESGDSKLFVVHVDELDGQFVHEIVELLKFVVRAFGMSTRKATAAAAARDTAARKQKQGAVLEEARKTLAATMAAMQQVGLTA